DLRFKIEDIKLTQRHNNEIRRLLCGLEHDLTDIIIENDNENQVGNTGSQGTNLGGQIGNTGSQGTNLGGQKQTSEAKKQTSKVKKQTSEVKKQTSEVEG
ncbi:12702_t:CDS:2, partial [Racocetra persica]